MKQGSGLKLISRLDGNAYAILTAELILIVEKGLDQKDGAKMKTYSIKDNRGRRSGYDQRIYRFPGPVLEKRKSKDRRHQLDRRKIKDPALRIVGDERRKSMRSLF